MRLVPTLWLVACTSELDPRPVRVPHSEPGPIPAPAGCATLDETERDYVPQGSAVDGVAPACTALTHPTAGAAGSVLAIEVDLKGTISVTDPAGRELLAPTPVEPGATVEIAPQVSGEVLVHLTSEVEQPYELAVSCADGCERRYTRYPILLMHGLGGAESFDGVDYFVGVEDALAAEGVVVVAPAVAPFDDSLDRALEWEVHLDALLAQGHRRVNLFGHSQGGTDARLLASEVALGRGDRIATVTTLGTPHRGTPVADLLVEGMVGGVIDPWALELGAEIFGGLFGVDADDPALAQALAQLSTPVSQALDVATPDHPATEYASWAGVSCGILEPVCQSQQGGEVVGALLAASYLLVWPTPNDGLVSADSQVHGIFLGEVPADHANEIGQMEDQTPDPFDHLRFYSAEAARLQAGGH